MDNSILPEDTFDGGLVAADRADCSNVGSPSASVNVPADMDFLEIPGYGDFIKNAVAALVDFERKIDEVSDCYPQDVVRDMKALLSYVLGGCVKNDSLLEDGSDEVGVDVKFLASNAVREVQKISDIQRVSGGTRRMVANLLRFVLGASREA